MTAMKKQLDTYLSRKAGNVTKRLLTDCKLSVPLHLCLHPFLGVAVEVGGGRDRFILSQIELRLGIFRHAAQQ